MFRSSPQVSEQTTPSRNKGHISNARSAETQLYSAKILTIKCMNAVQYKEFLEMIARSKRTEGAYDTLQDSRHRSLLFHFTEVASSLLNRRQSSIIQSAEMKF